jgi:hypothetical protein
MRNQFIELFARIGLSILGRFILGLSILGLSILEWGFKFSAPFRNAFPKLATNFEFLATCGLTIFNLI